MFAHFQQTDSSATIATTLKEANDYLVILPERSLSILNQHQSLLVTADAEQQAQWQLTKMIAAIRVANLVSIKDALISLGSLQSATYFQSHHEQILNGLGVWLRRSGYLLTAKSAYMCSYSLSTNKSSPLRPILNLAIVERNLGNFQQSKQLNLLALQMAKNEELAHYIAIIENNLGIISISEKRYHAAQKHFSNALDLNEKLQRRSGELLASMNLLLTFLYQDNPLYFNRLYDRAKRKLLLYPDTARGAYLAVLEAIYSAQTEPFTINNSKQKIRDNIVLVNDKGLQALLSPLINKVGVNYHPEQQDTSQRYSGDMLKHYSMCNWNSETNDAHLQQLLVEFNATSSQE